MKSYNNLYGSILSRDENFACKYLVKYLLFLLKEEKNNESFHFVRKKLIVMVKEIIERISSEKGKRPVLFSKCRNVLEGYDLSFPDFFDYVFNVPFKVFVSSDRKKVMMTADAFDPKKCMNGPSEASHFRIKLHMGVLIDLEWDEKEHNYVFKDPLVGNVGNHEKSDYLPMDSVLSDNFKLVVENSNKRSFLEFSTVIVAVGIEFFRLIGDEYYPVENMEVMKVVKAI